MEKLSKPLTWSVGPVPQIGDRIETPWGAAVVTDSFVAPQMSFEEVYEANSRLFQRFYGLTPPE